MGSPASHGYRHPRRGGSLPMESVAGLLWNQWQLSCGTDGSFAVESVAGFTWNQWQLCRGIRSCVTEHVHGSVAVGLFNQFPPQIPFEPLGYALKAGQLTYDCRYSTMHGMPVTGGRGFRSLKPLWYNGCPALSGYPFMWSVLS